MTTLSAVVTSIVARARGLRSPVPRCVLIASILATAPLQGFSGTIVDGVLIDDFVVQQTVEVTAPAIAIGFDANSSTTTAIGGEREVYVRKTAGGNGERVRARVNP